MFLADDTTQRYLPDWVILGDNSRKVFLDWLLCGTKLRTYGEDTIWARQGMQLSLVQQGRHCFIETPALLPRTTLCFPPSDGSAEPETTKRTRYAVLEEFPFRKQASIDLVRNAGRAGNEVLLVLMDLPRHQGSTDLVAPGEDLHQAMEEYRSESCAVSVVQSADSMRQILHWHKPICDVWADRARDHLTALRDRISEIPYDYLSVVEDWQDVGGALQEETMDKLFSFEKAKEITGGSLWGRFADIAKRSLFPTSGQGPLFSVTKLYRECLNNPLVFWSVDDDVRGLLDDLQHAFTQKVTEQEGKGNYQYKTRISSKLDEKNFYRLVAHIRDSGTAINATFSELIRDYLCNDVQRHLEERLDRRCKQLEGMIR